DLSTGEPREVAVRDERPVETRRRDLESVPPLDRILDVQLHGKLPADPGTVIQRHAPILVDIQPHEKSPGLASHFQMNQFHACKLQDLAGHGPDPVEDIGCHVFPGPDIQSGSPQTRDLPKIKKWANRQPTEPLPRWYPILRKIGRA